MSGFHGDKKCWCQLYFEKDTRYCFPTACNKIQKGVLLLIETRLLFYHRTILSFVRPDKLHLTKFIPRNKKVANIWPKLYYTKTLLYS